MSANPTDFDRQFSDAIQSRSMKRKVISTDPETGDLIEEWVSTGPARARLRWTGLNVDGVGARLRPPDPVPLYPKGEWVYFVQAGESGPIKIGCTKQLGHRITCLQTASPVPLKLIGIIQGYKETEASLHIEFVDDWVRGEWFKPSDELLAVARGELVLTIAGLRPPRETK